MKIALIGYGRMGHMIEEIAVSRGHEIVCTVDVDNPEAFDSEAFRSADVAIEFTMPSSAHANVLKAFGVPFETHVFSAHRSPDQARDFARGAREEGYGVIIAAAGMAAHLGGAIAANTTLPVVGIPCKGGALDGLDALLSTVQMPSGIPVATVALNGGANAALLAIEILAVADDSLADKLQAKRRADAEAVLKKDAAITSALK